MPDWLVPIISLIGNIQTWVAAFIALVVLLFVMLFPRLVRGLFRGRHVDEIKIGIGGISVKLAADEIAKANEVWNLPGTDAAEIQARLQALVRIPRILWVDDRPRDTKHEIRALQLIGYEVSLVGSNDEAARHYRRRHVDVVVSDIKREREGPEAGLLLPDRLAAVRTPIPAIIYYLGNVVAPTTPAGHPVTDKPLELFRLIGEALENQDKA